MAGAGPVGADSLLPAMISNRVCYGIKAAVAFLLEEPAVMHGSRDEKRIVRACPHTGGMEAIMCSTEFAVDGHAGEMSMTCLRFLRNIGKRRLVPRRPACVPTLTN